MKKKRKSYKKILKEKKHLKTKILSLLRKYSIKQWLIFIRKLNINPSELIHRAEFLTVASDMAIRIAKKNDNELSIPSVSECSRLIYAEIELSDGSNNLIKLFGIGGISLFAVWQNRLNYIDVNILGRMPLLYKNYNKHLASTIGITIEDIYIILLAIRSVYREKEIILFKKSLLIAPKITSLSEEKINNFLLYFSRTPEQYKQEARKEKIYENSFGKFKYLVRYPIIELNSEEYIIPVFEQLLDTVSNNLYFILLESFASQGRKISKQYQDEFGEVLEKYVLNFAEELFGKDNVIRADEIVTAKDEDRCEAVIYHDNKALAIEVKKMNFKRDAIANKDKEYIDNIIERHLVKAFKQVENTMKYIKSDICYGLIILPDIMLSFSSMIIYMKDRFEGMALFDNRIQICTLSWYESLMANDKNTIFEILEKAKNRNIQEGNDIIHVMTDMKNKGFDINFKNKKLMDSTNYILLNLNN